MLTASIWLAPERLTVRRPAFPFPAAALRRRGIDAAAGWSANSWVASARLQLRASALNRWLSCTFIVTDDCLGPRDPSV